MEETKRERAVLAGLHAPALPPEQQADEETLAELRALLETAGGECAATVLQQRAAPDPRTLFGGGKMEEIAALARREEAGLLIVDNEISPSQMRALEEETGCAVLDRSGLILDIFAQRAKTNEGKLQVELAQYQYILPRLAGLGKTLSRLGGGIGTRGPGESKLESDRRHIRRRIYRLQEELERVRRVRAVQRRARIKAEIPQVSLVGYTNAGKSTLLNRLTGADIPANDRLFDTLDPTTRKMKLSDTQEIFLSDTVGFIRKLPHHLIDAFKATLEEVADADLLLHVVDLSHPQWREQAQTVERVLAELGAEHIPRLTVLNKADACPADAIPKDGEDWVAISARQGWGLANLKAAMERALARDKHVLTVCLPYDQGALLNQVHELAQIRQERYLPDGVEIELVCGDTLWGRLRPYQK